MDENSNKIKTFESADDKTARVTAFNRETYGERIRAFRVARGLTQPKLASILRTSRNYVSNWEIGRARPDMNMVPALCDALGITVAQFFGRDEDAPDPETKHMIETYRLLDVHNRNIADAMLDTLLEVQEREIRERCEGRFLQIFCGEQFAAAGVLNPLDDNAEGEKLTLRRTPETERADEIITVSGDSMEPTFQNGDRLLVERTDKLRDGEIGIVIINGEGFVKEFRANGVYSHNALKYPFRAFEEGDDVRCFGRVIGKVDEDMYPTEAEQRALEEMRFR